MVTVKDFVLLSSFLWGDESSSTWLLDKVEPSPPGDAITSTPIPSFPCRFLIRPGGPAEIQHRLHPVHAWGPQHAADVWLDGQDSGLPPAQPPPQVPAQVLRRASPHRVPAQTQRPSSSRPGGVVPGTPLRGECLSGRQLQREGPNCHVAGRQERAAMHSSHLGMLEMWRPWWTGGLMILVLHFLRPSSVMYLIDMVLRRQTCGTVWFQWLLL